MERKYPETDSMLMATGHGECLPVCQVEAGATASCNSCRVAQALVPWAIVLQVLITARRICNSGRLHWGVMIAGAPGDYPTSRRPHDLLCSEFRQQQICRLAVG